MGMFLNSMSPYRKYQAVVTDTYFVDKTPLIEDLLPALGKEKRFFLYYKTASFWENCHGKYDCLFFWKGDRQQ